MRTRLQRLYERLTNVLGNSEQGKTWNALTGLFIMGGFVVASVLFSGTVQALYYAGTYGYNTSNQSSDFLPKPPTGFSATVTTTTAALSWTAPTQTTGNTSLDNLHATEAYLIHYSTSALSTTMCSGGDSTTSSTASVSLGGGSSPLSAGTTYYVNICSKDARSNRSDDLGTTAGVLANQTFTTANVSGGNPGGSGAPASSVGVGVTVAPTTTAPTTGSVAAITPPGEDGIGVQAITALTNAQLSNPADVAAALGVNATALAAAVPATRTVVAAQLQAAFNITALGNLSSLSTVIAGVGLRNPELSTARGQEGFVRDLAAVVGSVAMRQAAAEQTADAGLVHMAAASGTSTTSTKAEIIADLAASMALGTPIDRKSVEGKFGELGKSLLAAERGVITGGTFQKLFNRLPKTNTEWDFVRKLSYRARTVARNTTKEVQARQAYEKKFKVNMVVLARSTKPADVLKTSEAWSTIRVLSKSPLLSELTAR